MSDDDGMTAPSAAEEIESLKKEVENWKAISKRHQEERRELGERFVETKKALSILQAFRELDSCAVPLEEHEKLQKRYDDLFAEYKRSNKIMQAPIEEVIDMVACELLCMGCFCRTMHVAGSDAMQARLIKYYHGQYADNARAHTRIKAASSKEMEKIVAVLQARLARGEKAFPLGEFTERDMAERMRERAAKEPDKPVPEKKKRWFW